MGEESHTCTRISREKPIFKEERPGHAARIARPVTGKALRKHLQKLMDVRI
ncbi:hypothetical protein ASZ90_010448 [hydrocarbon metagenome]|uniref:Uncharacterized protein n=1 Tax=hydrocarbon metagenome TaxID=938273 RepID=A0A0W8FG39_9ZZZZ